LGEKAIMGQTHHHHEANDNNEDGMKTEPNEEGELQQAEECQLQWWNPWLWPNPWYFWWGNNANNNNCRQLQIDGDQMEGQLDNTNNNNGVDGSGRGENILNFFLFANHH
jgi:hypothetical protein